jgi:hypothetical protein
MDPPVMPIQMRRFSIFIFLLSMSFTSCNQIFSEEITVIKEIDNHAKNKKAVLFLKRGNAVTNDSFHITVCNIENTINNEETGNILTAELINGTESNPLIKIKWIDNQTLNIEFPKSTKTFKKELHLDGINITYTITK